MAGLDGALGAWARCLGWLAVHGRRWRMDHRRPCRHELWSADGAPADLAALVAGDALHAFCRLVRHKRLAGVEEVKPGRRAGLRLVLGVLGDRLNTQLGHLQGVLLGRSAEDPGLDLAHTLA